MENNLNWGLPVLIFSLYFHLRIILWRFYFKKRFPTLLSFSICIFLIIACPIPQNENDEKENNDLTKITTFPTIQAGINFSLVTKNNCTVYTWGDNWKDQLGRGVMGSTDDTPDIVPGIPGKVVKVNGGYTHSLVIIEDGNLYGWGSNENDQIGVGAGNFTTPQEVPIDNVIEISAGPFHTVALKSDGSVWTWGENQDSQLGRDSTPDTPGQVPGLDLDE